MHSMTDRMGQWIDKRFEKAGPIDNPQIQAKRDALRGLFAGVPAAAQGGKLPFEALEKLASAAGPFSDPEQEQKRQMMLDRLHLAEAASESGLLSGLMPPAQAADGRFRLREFVVIPGQEYLIDGTCIENSAEGPEGVEDKDRCLIAKGRHEPTFLISTKSDVQIHHALQKRALLMIFGGAALTLACTAGLLVHFGLF
jgi:hypothetical protein